MFDSVKKIIEKIKKINSNIDKYKKDTVVQSLPSYTYVNRAKKLIEESKYEEAKEVLQKALALPQQDPLVYKYLGAVYEKLGDNEEALKNYQISADLSPQDKVIWQRLGFSLISSGKFEQAEKSFDNANKIQAGNSDTFTGWGMALMKQKKYAEAREKFSEAAKFNKYNFVAVFLCAVAEIKLEMYDKAEMKLTFLANVCPNANNTFEFARLKAIKNDYESAIHYALKSLDFNEKMLSAYILLGQLYAARFDMENSLKYFEIAEQKDLQSFDLYLEWGKVLEKFEQFSEAKTKLSKAMEISPENIEVMACLGLSLVNQKEFEEARPLLEKVLEKDPENLITKQALGIIAYENNEIEKAMAFFRSNDEDSINCCYMAKCYEKLKNDTKVREYYESALLHNPKSIKVFSDYSKYLIGQNDYQEAQRKLRKALKVFPDDVKFLNLMFYVSYILVKENLCDYNVKETIAIAQKVETIAPGAFEYPEQKAELEAVLQKNPESE